MQNDALQFDSHLWPEWTKTVVTDSFLCEYRSKSPDDQRGEKRRVVCQWNANNLNVCVDVVVKKRVTKTLPLRTGVNNETKIDVTDATHRQNRWRAPTKMCYRQRSVPSYTRDPSFEVGDAPTAEIWGTQHIAFVESALVFFQTGLKKGKSPGLAYRCYDYIVIMIIFINLTHTQWNNITRQINRKTFLKWWNLI